MMLPSYAPTTVWERGNFLLIWTPGKVRMGRATKTGRVVNRPDCCVYAYHTRTAALYKLKQLRGEVEPVQDSGKGLPKNFKGRTQRS